MVRKKGGGARSERSAGAQTGGARAPGEDAGAHAPKSIILFSDGTGNSSGKLFKTNVWRMYEAVALGPSPERKREQISYYDDGVGTSGFKPLAALGGAFGWGLKRNVLDLYRYASRNYRDGDHIYGFGFSRGAFTMRLVMALVASQGLVASDDETELARKSKCAYRAFRASFRPRKFEKLVLAVRSARDKWIGWRDRGKKIKPYDRTANRDPVIRFVGVWDTVAAYGGPIAEMTRAVDNWLYPLSMPDYELSEKVECARHALALDDERDAFQPLLWDEVAEESRCNAARDARVALLEQAEVARKARKMREVARLTAEAEAFGERERHFRTRLQQVWFTGMHADVGGGYPDESLSYVSLLWMMEEAEAAGLRTIDSIKARFFALANSYGPMHDSRAGLGAYYRYQPRKIAAWMEPPDDRYLMLRDPDIQDSSREHGLLRRVLVHESVIARIHTGTVRYAPVALPERFEVIPPQREGETIELAESDDEPGDAGPAPPSEPLISPELRARLAASAAARFACQENLWDLVWWRRIVYFAAVAVTLLLVVLPAWNPLPFAEMSCSDARCVLPSLIRSANVLVPGFAEGWIDAIAEFPVTALIYFLAIIFLLRWGKRIECRLGDRSWRLWRAALDGAAIPDQSCAETKLRRFREGRFYQKLFRRLKWFWLPAFFGVLMLAVLLYIPLVLLTQGSLAWNEATHYYCRHEAGGPARQLGRADFIFDTSQPCVSPGLEVKKDQVYEIAFQLPLDDKTGEPAPWFDASIPSRPGSLTRIRASGFWQLLGMPMRRVIEASYLQPLAQISSDKDGNIGWPWLPDWLGSRLPDLDRAYVTRLALKPDEDWPELYRVRFTAPESGNLHLFANDAQFPFGRGRRFYRNNCGIARVTVTHILPRRKNSDWLVTNPGPAVTLPDCARERIDALAKEGPRLEDAAP
jgi:uncharacterized protein (DUF2235 family)